jgi:pimeloyl-ACP methyl ester carboxylesterase
MIHHLKQRALPGRPDRAPIAALTGADRARSSRGDRVMDVRAFHTRRRFAETPCGRIAYVEQGEGPVAVFLHGMPLNGFHWRHVMAGMSDVRRCIAPDLMGAGYSEIAPGQDLSFAAQAAMVAQFIDALGVDTVDLIGNDTGGAVAQIFAVNHPHRLRTLTLTNCDVHDNWPPPGALPLIEAARLGTLAEGYRALLGDVEAARARFSRVYADPGFITEEVLRVYFEPVLWSEQRKADFHRYWLSFDPQQTISIEPRLRTLGVPTLIVWALDDVFFAPKWGQWLRDTIPGAVDLVKVPDARLFFAEDRPAALIHPLRAFAVSRE